MFWPPQNEALLAIQQIYQQTEIPQPQIIQIPTGCGKSTIISMLPRYIFSHADRLEKEIVILVIVPNLALIKQTTHAIQQSYQRHPPSEEGNESITCTEIQSISHLVEFLHEREATVHVPLTYQFLVTNIHKLASNTTLTRLQWQRIARGIDIVAIDEAHHMPASSWQKFLFNHNSIGFRIQRQLLFTATPFRTDKQPLRGGLCYFYPYRSAVASKLIKHPLIHLLQSAHHLDRSQRFIRLLQRTKAIHDREGEGGQIIGYAQNINDAQYIMELCQEHMPSLRIDIWHSKMSEEAQQAVRARFEQVPPQLDFIIQVRMCSEGYDHPPVNIVTFFKRIKSPLSFMQAVGRATRQSPALLFAHVVGDDYHHHSFQRLWQHFKLHADDSKLDDFVESSDAVNDISSSSSHHSSRSSPSLALPVSSSTLTLSSSPSSFVPSSTPSPSSATTPPSSPFWWVDPFDSTLLPSNILQFFENDGEEDGDDDDESDGDGDDVPLTPDDLEALSHLSIRSDPPFQLQAAGHQIIRSPQQGSNPSTTLSLDTLNKDDIGLARLPPPNQKFIVAFASYDCTPPMVRELSPHNLLNLFPTMDEPKIQQFLNSKKNRKEDNKHYICDRLLAYYYFLAHPIKRPPSNILAPPSPKRVCTPRQYSMVEALNLIESKEEALQRAKASFEAAQRAQENLNQALSLLK